MEEFIYIFDPDTRSIESNLLTMYDCINWMLEHDCRYNATELKRLKKLQEIIKKEEEKLK